jgi:hypothetical protein
MLPCSEELIRHTPDCLHALPLGDLGEAERFRQIYPGELLEHCPALSDQLETTWLEEQKKFIRLSDSDRPTERPQTAKKTEPPREEKRSYSFQTCQCRCLSDSDDSSNDIDFDFEGVMATDPPPANPDISYFEESMPTNPPPLNPDVPEGAPRPIVGPPVPPPGSPYSGPEDDNPNAAKKTGSSDPTNPPSVRNGPSRH